MSTIGRNLFNRLFHPTPLRAIVLGLDASGKTTFLYFLGGKVVHTIPFIGFLVETTTVPSSSGNTVEITALELGGCSAGSILRLSRVYIEAAVAIIWMVDSTDKERLQDSVDLLRDVIGLGFERPILILANKSDRPNSLSIEELQIAFSPVTAGQLSSMFKTTFVCKSYRETGMPEAFDWLNASLDSAKSLKKPGPPTPDLQAKSRTRSVLTQKLESWLARAENDIPADEFLEKFRSYTLPDWDHYTHIRYAYLILIKHGRQEGKDVIFKGLEDYIANSQQTKGRSFHITMTYFWIQIVHLGIQNTPPVLGSTNPLNEFGHFLLVNRHVVDGNLWSDFYSKDVLMSPEAKTAMVLPDKKPLPNLVDRDAITSFGAS